MKKMKVSPSCLLMCILFLFSGIGKAQFIYPVSKTVTQSDNYFGISVNDPYRWLENDTATDTKAWVKTQQKFTEDYLSKIPFREQIRNRFKQIINFTRYYGAFKVGEYIVYSQNDGVHNQPVYYIQKGLKGNPSVFIDPNTLSKDGTVSVGIDGVSNNKKYISYHVNKGGSDWITLYVMDVTTQTKLPDEINNMKFGGTAWYGNGFYYSRYDKPKAGTELTAKNENSKIYYHKLGDKQENDKLIYEDTLHPNLYLGAQVSEDERFLYIVISPGTDGTEVWFKDLRKDQKDFKILFKGFESNYAIITNTADKILVLTNNGADNYRVVEVDPANPDMKNWKNIIPEKTEKLEAASSGGNKLFCSYLQDASTKIYQYSLLGKEETKVDLPGFGSASGIGGFQDDSCSFYDYASFTYPPSIFYYNIKNHKSEVFKKSESQINPDEYTTEQVFYPSKDGTKVPMFIIHKKNLKLDGSHPTLLYAYGGFNISLTPFFGNSLFMLLEQNGIYVSANIRGGGEYGEKWHKAGNLLNKQNVFDDFIAAGEYLIKNKYTTKDLLAINGGSNGGLLIGAVMTQRPELFKVALPEVGVMDMLRFQKFTVGWGWTVEYGSSDSAKYFPYLYKYSPLHHLKKGTTYPATMIFTADHDDRVVPAHSFKFGATLQTDQAGNSPVLIRIDTNQGHGGGSSLNHVIDRVTDLWSFMFYNMGITPKY